MRWMAVLALVLAACGGSAPARQEGREEQSAAPTAAAAFPLNVIEATYGALAVRTAANASCTAEIRFTMPDLGEAPPPTTALAGRADASGLARWSYATPRLPGDRVPYAVWCEGDGRSGKADGDFRVERRPIAPASFKVRLESGPPRDKPVSAEDPALVPLRDKGLAQLRTTLATEWRNATRGLSTLALVSEGADILVSVVAARGTSLHRSSKRDGSEDVVVYVADEHGPTSVENIVAVTMHELGHIWCCFGPGTSDGHWSTKQEDPGLYGVDRYGLMNHPIDCKVYASSITSCPNRFSDRELKAFGFADIPPPTTSPCSNVPSMKAELDQLRAQMAAVKTEIDAIEAAAKSKLAQIRAIEAQYPSRVLPPDVYARYTALVDQYNALVKDDKAKIDQYNALVSRSNALGSQINSMIGC